MDIKKNCFNGSLSYICHIKSSFLLLTYESSWFDALGVVHSKPSEPNFTLIKLNIPKLIFIIFQDIKNAELALFELNRVINLAPDHPEVFEQRAEVLFLF